MISDPLKRLKAIAFHRAFPDTEGQIALPDLIIHAKMFLCEKTHTLFNDPLWNTYTDEEILIEYFTWLFRTNDDFKKSYELPEEVLEDVYSWLDKMVEENQKELDNDMEDEVIFEP